MPNTLKCESNYSYKYDGGHQPGTGLTQAAAEKNALSQFAKDAVEKAEGTATEEARRDNSCEGTDCVLSVSSGKSVFETTEVNQIEGGFSVKVTLFVPITVSCIKRKISPPKAVRTELAEFTNRLTSTPVKDVGTEVGRMNLIVSALPQSE